MKVVIQTDEIVQKMSLCPVNEITFTIPLKPCPCPRPRVTKQGRTYYPANYRNWVRAASEHVQDAAQTKFAGAVRVEITFNESVPPSYSKTRLKSCLDGLETEWPKSGDLDNLCKSILDVLTGVAWDDDKQVVRLTASKRYADRNSITVRVAPYMGHFTANQGGE